jgi:hypothetical protein
MMISLSYLISGYTSAKKSNSYPSGVSINLEGGNRSSEKWKREEVVMANEWLTDARKIPDEVMSYIRKLAVRAVVEFGWSPECVYAVFGLSRSSLYDWL